MMRFQEAGPRKKFSVEHVLLALVILLVGFLILRTVGSYNFFGTSKKRAVICIISSSSAIQTQVHASTSQLEDFISNLQAARFSVREYGDDLNTLTYDIVLQRLNHCDLVIINNFKMVSQVLLNAIYDYVKNGGKLILIGDSLSMRYIPSLNGTKTLSTGYIQNIFGAQFDLVYDPASGTYHVKIYTSTDPELVAFEPDNPIFKDCIPEEGKVKIPGTVSYVSMIDEDIDLLAWLKGQDGSKPAILYRSYGSGKVVIFTYDPLKTPCILANTISYLIWGTSGSNILGINVPAKIF